MTKTEKEILTENYSYKKFIFVIKIILKEHSLEIEGFEGDNSITSAKVFFNPLVVTNTRFQRHLSSDPAKEIVDDVKESLRTYADYKKATGRSRYGKQYKHVKE